MSKKIKLNGSRLTLIGQPVVELYRRFLVALSFLTVLPVPIGKLSGESIGGAAAFFPLVGALLGLTAAVLGFALDRILPAPVTSAVLVLFLVVATGGLHLDGLADTADGLFGGKNRRQSLTIMRRGEVGAFGAAAVVLALLLKHTLLNSFNGGHRLQVLLAAPAISRWLMVVAARLFPAARRTGLGTTFIQGTGNRELAIATLLALAGSMALGFASIAVLPVSLLFLLAFSRMVTGRLGGLTGDTLGALAESGEVFVLLAALIIWR